MERLDKVILARYPDLTRSRIEGLVKAGYVTVNGAAAEKAGQKVSGADAIAVTLPPPVPATPEPEDIPLSILYEDDDLIALDKPAGLVVHPAPGHATGTLVNALLRHCPQLRDLGCRERPGIVHRLDQETSGVMVVAKTEAARQGLIRAFASHRDVEKVYLALVHGRPRLDAGRLETLIGRHPADRKRFAVVERNGKPAITNWERVLELRGFGVFESNHPTSQTSLIECAIETGRTHQIRVHMASCLGCPVVGDKLYGKPARDRLLSPVPQRQMLHAWRLALWHPTRRVRLAFEAPLPPDLSAYLPAAWRGEGVVRRDGGRG